MKESIIITIINAVKDIAISLFSLFHKSIKPSIEKSSEEAHKTIDLDDKIEVPPAPHSIEAEPIGKTTINNPFIASDAELENMDINDPEYFEKMGARLAMTRPIEEIEIL